MVNLAVVYRKTVVCSRVGDTSQRMRSEAGAESGAVHQLFVFVVLRAE